MAKKKVTAPTQVEANVSEIFSKSERFIEKNKNRIINVVAAIVLLVVIILGIRQYYFIPKEKEAQAAIFPGQNYLENQQWDIALNGNGADYIGFIGVMEDYGITKTAKLANAYAGICYYHLGEPAEALKYLKKFKANDKIISPVIKGLIGDCYVDLGEITEGIKYFDKAASEASSNVISPIYLKKAGIAHESVFDYSNALNSYQKIKDKYPNSPEASDIDKYIERAKMQIK